MPCSPTQIPLDPLTVDVPSATLHTTWERELHSIGEHLNVPRILHHVAHAQGFVWGLYAGELISAEQQRVMNEAVQRAERAAFRRVAEGKP
ncbi:hypothetical protein ACYZTX_29045 [Pseudomonas sp. MDT1-17]